MNMDDREIIELFFGRSEAAVSATEEKYGAYFRYIVILPETSSAMLGTSRSA